jgi:hypothetical protein
MREEEVIFSDKRHNGLPVLISIQRLKRDNVMFISSFFQKMHTNPKISGQIGKAFTERPIRSQREEFFGPKSGRTAIATPQTLFHKSDELCSFRRRVFWGRRRPIFLHA